MVSLDCDAEKVLQAEDDTRSRLDASVQRPPVASAAGDKENRVPFFAERRTPSLLRSLASHSGRVFDAGELLLLKRAGEFPIEELLEELWLLVSSLRELAGAVQYALHEKESLEGRREIRGGGEKRESGPDEGRAAKEEGEETVEGDLRSRDRGGEKKGARRPEHEASHQDSEKGVSAVEGKHTETADVRSHESVGSNPSLALPPPSVLAIARKLESCCITSFFSSSSICMSEEDRFLRYLDASLSSLFVSHVQPLLSLALQLACMYTLTVVWLGDPEPFLPLRSASSLRRDGSAPPAFANASSGGRAQLSFVLPGLLASKITTSSLPSQSTPPAACAAACTRGPGGETPGQEPLSQTARDRENLFSLLFRVFDKYRNAAESRARMQTTPTLLGAGQKRAAAATTPWRRRHDDKEGEKEREKDGEKGSDREEGERGMGEREKSREGTLKSSEGDATARKDLSWVPAVWMHAKARKGQATEQRGEKETSESRIFPSLPLVRRVCEREETKKADAESERGRFPKLDLKERKPTPLFSLGSALRRVPSKRSVSPSSPGRESGLPSVPSSAAASSDSPLASLCSVLSAEPSPAVCSPFKRTKATFLGSLQVRPSLLNRQGIEPPADAGTESPEAFLSASRSSSVANPSSSFFASSSPQPFPFSSKDPRTRVAPAPLPVCGGAKDAPPASVGEKEFRRTRETPPEGDLESSQLNAEEKRKARGETGAEETQTQEGRATNEASPYAGAADLEQSATGRKWELRRREEKENRKENRTPFSPCCFPDLERSPVLPPWADAIGELTERRETPQRGERGADSDRGEEGTDGDGGTGVCLQLVSPASCREGSLRRVCERENATSFLGMHALANAREGKLAAPGEECEGARDWGGCTYTPVRFGRRDRGVATGKESTSGERKGEV
ncbi:hypothetical protein TGPRC2_311280 [Toxoplasma gondii TgCatPRC2]|uniref:Uncharacterized protein n=1 Tax=Toxoplasma gondii TgCatPRC2 TaxID=1130821 RepID=A0A151HKU9_TOXGO|nr:hypothetical protein TGPRC2_311280 [Toxoplasma gondii TgCatPRC2]